MKLSEDDSIFGRFAAIADQYSGQIAISDSIGSLTYSDVRNAAEEVAYHLADLKLPVDRPVNVYLPTGRDWAISVLGVLAAGHFYVPVDPTFPDARNAKILEQADASVTITSSEVENSTNIDLGDTTLLLDRCTSGRPFDWRRHQPRSIDSLASVIYTSGSTGEPRGVMQTHKSTLHGAYRRADIQNVKPTDRMTWLYSSSVKGTEYCYYVAMLHGAALFPRRIGVADDEQLDRWLTENDITIFHSVASYFRVFADYVEAQQKRLPSSLRLVILGGERVLKSDVDAFFRLCPQDCRLFTAIGSTETGTICYLPFEYLRTQTEPIVPVGTPVDGMDVQIVDDQWRQVRPGEPGQILVRSEYISPGYWKAESSSFRREKSNPEVIEFLSQDLGQFGDDGILRHRGRSDNRLKINGYLVNLGEVESVLLTHAAVDDVVAKMVEGSEQEGSYLAAFVLAIPDMLNESDVRRWLEDRLPHQMVPTRFAFLDQWPRLPNGKIDRKQLTAELLSRPTSEVDNEDSIESRIAGVWRKVLNRDDVDFDTAFTELGGDSLAFLALSTELTSLGYKGISLAELIQNQTIRRQAALVTNRSAVNYAMINPLQIGRPGPVHFLVPPWGGGKLLFNDFVKHASRSANFYSLEVSGVEQDSSQALNVDFAVDALTDQLLASNLTNSFHLAGYSSGGMIAMDLAQRLIDRGERVETVVLIDAVHPEVYDPSSPESSWAFGTANPRIRLLFKHRHVLRQLPIDRQVSYILDRWRARWRRRRKPSSEPPIRSEKTKELIRRKKAFFKTYVRKSYSFDIQIIRATQYSKVDRWLDRQLGWRDFVSGSVETHDFESTHNSMLRSDAAEGLANLYLKITETG